MIGTSNIAVNILLTGDTLREGVNLPGTNTKNGNGGVGEYQIYTGRKPGTEALSGLERFHRSVTSYTDNLAECQPIIIQEN